MVLTELEQLKRVADDVEGGRRCAVCLRWIGEKGGPLIRGCLTCMTEDAEWLGRPKPGRA